MACGVDGCDGVQEGGVWNAKEAKRYCETQAASQGEGHSTGLDSVNFRLLSSSSSSSLLLMMMLNKRATAQQMFRLHCVSKKRAVEFLQ